MLCNLSKGLLVAPIKSQSSGNIFEFGSGICLISDSLKKCLCYAYGGDKLYIILVDVILDKVFKISKNNEFIIVKGIKMKGYICLINNSQKYISFENRIYFNNGMTIPIEKERENITFDYSLDMDSGYDSKLVKINYIVEL